MRSADVMVITKRALDRRTVLRGMGAAIALPVLDAMTPALTAAAAPVVRLGFFYVPNGFYLPHIHPEGAAGKNFTLSPILTPMEAHRDRLVFVSGLSNMIAN